MISKKKKILSALLASSMLIPQTALVAFAGSSEDVGISLAEQTELVQAEKGTDPGSFTVSYSINGVEVKDVDKAVLYIGDQLKFTIRPAKGYEIVRAYNESKGTTEFTDMGDGSFEHVFEIYSIPGLNHGYVGVAGGPWGSYIYVQTRAVEGGGSGSAYPGVDGTDESWSAIAANIGRLGKGESETINLNGFTIVPAEVFKAIANSGAKITFVSDEYESADGMFCWKFDGSDFKAADAKDADLTVRKRTMSSTGSLRGTNGGGFTLNGTNNKASKLSVALGSENSGKFANLYKLELGRFKFVDTAIIDKNGKVSGFSASEKGDYVVMLGSYSDMPGDADNNGVLNSLDAMVILKGVVGLAQAANPQVTDINGDGKTDVKDAVQILKIVVGLA